MGNTAYGVTDQGFVLKPVSQIIQEIEDDQLALIDPTLDTSSTSPLGANNGIIGSKLGEVWELAQVAYNATNRDAATGALLDNIGAITGSLRKTAKPSYVYCTVAFSLAQTYAAGTLVAYLPSNPAIKFSNGLDIDVTATGTQAAQALFVSVEDGPDPANAVNAVGVNSLTGMVAVTGWTSVTNPADAVPGTLEQDDPDYRTNQEEELAAAGAGTLAALRSDLLQVPGVVSVQPYENTSLVTDPTTGLPPKSFMAVVWDGLIPAASNDSIAQVIWNDKPAGIEPFGSTTGNATDAEGNSHAVPFNRPTQLPVYMAVTVTLAQGAVLATVAQAVKAALVAASQGQPFEVFGNTITPTDPIQAPGENVEALAYQTVARGVTGVAGVTGLTLGFSASPTGTADLTVGITSVAVLDTSRITVNGV